MKAKNVAQNRPQERICNVIYPDNSNTDYVMDSNRNNRRQNQAMDKYNIMYKVNGSLDVKVRLDKFLPADVPSP